MGLGLGLGLAQENAQLQADLGVTVARPKNARVVLP